MKHLVDAARGEVTVGIDQAGSNCETVEIDDACARTSATLHLHAGTYSDNLALGDRNSFNDGVLSVDSENLAVDQDQIRCLRGGNSRQREKQHCGWDLQDQTRCAAHDNQS